jgi:carbonic anhydrase
MNIDNIDVEEAVNISAYIDKVVTESDCITITEDNKGITPDEALNLLMEGNMRFYTDNSEQINSSTTRVQQTSSVLQSPFAMIFSCSNSLNPPPTIFNRGVGDIFEARTIAESLYNNITTGADISIQTIESIEFAINTLKCPLLVTMGHTKCTTIEGAYNYFSTNTAPAVKEKTPYYVAYNSLYNSYEELKKTNKPTDRILMSLLQTVDVSNYLKNNSTIISDAVKNGKTMIVNAMYDDSSGVVTFYDINGDPIIQSNI